MQVNSEIFFVTSCVGKHFPLHLQSQNENGAWPVGKGWLKRSGESHTWMKHFEIQAQNSNRSLNEWRLIADPDNADGGIIRVNFFKDWCSDALMDKTINEDRGLNDIGREIEDSKGYWFTRLVYSVSISLRTNDSRLWTKENTMESLILAQDER